MGHARRIASGQVKAEKTMEDRMEEMRVLEGDIVGALEGENHCGEMSNLETD